MFSITGKTYWGVEVVRSAGVFVLQEFDRLEAISSLFSACKFGIWVAEKETRVS